MSDADSRSATTEAPARIVAEESVQQAIKHRSIVVRLQRLAVPGALALLIVAVSVANPRFLSVGNLINIGTTMAPIGVIAVGMALLLISGNFDLSVGGVGGLVAVTGAWLINQVGLPWALVIVMFLAAICGGVNALLVVGLRVNSLIATLGTGFVLGGIATVMSGTSPIQIEERDLLNVMSGRLANVPIPIIILVVVVALGVLFSHTVGGRALFAVGANREASRYAGIPVRKVSAIPFLVVAVLAGLAAVISLGYVNSGLPDMGVNWPLQVIAAVVVGGVSISGGEGSVLGAVAGVALIGVVQNGLVFTGVNSNYQNIIIGTIIIVAVAVDVQLRGREVSAD